MRGGGAGRLLASLASRGAAAASCSNSARPESCAAAAAAAAALLLSNNGASSSGRSIHTRKYSSAISSGGSGGSAPPSTPLAAGPGPSSARQALAAADLAAAPRLPPRPWHQLQHAAAYRPPTKQKQGKKGGKGGDGAGGDEAGAAGAGAASFEDDSGHAGDAVRVLLQAVDNVIPHLDVRTIRTATKSTYVPGVMPAEKGRSLALHWLVAAAAARKKGSRAPFAECLALELLLAYQKRGAARQKRDDLHKLALQNRANLHLRWW
jgi:small subunit ribosomal protein S7